MNKELSIVVYDVIDVGASVMRKIKKFVRQIIRPIFNFVYEIAVMFRETLITPQTQGRAPSGKLALAYVSIENPMAFGS